MIFFKIWPINSASKKNDPFSLWVECTCALIISSHCSINLIISQHFVDFHSHSAWYKFQIYICFSFYRHRRSLRLQMMNMNHGINMSGIIFCAILYAVRVKHNTSFSFIAYFNLTLKFNRIWSVEFRYFNFKKFMLMDHFSHETILCSHLLLMHDNWFRFYSIKT